jgi:hypothetical protein
LSVSPDGGDGSMEILVLVALVAIVVPLLGKSGTFSALWVR